MKEAWMRAQMQVVISKMRADLEEKYPCQPDIEHEQEEYTVRVKQTSSTLVFFKVPSVLLQGKISIRGCVSIKLKIQSIAGWEGSDLDTYV